MLTLYNNNNNNNSNNNNNNDNYSYNYVFFRWTRPPLTRLLMPSIRHTKETPSFIPSYRRVERKSLNYSPIRSQRRPFKVISFVMQFFIEYYYCSYI